MSTNLYSVHPASFHQNFPPNFPVPPLLLEFASWLQEEPWLSVGEVRLRSERWNDFYATDSADLAGEFAPFFSTCDGSYGAFWLHDNADIADPPIIFLGSEGELTNLGASLPDFLRRLARGETGVEALDYREDADEGPALLRWLSDRGLAEPQPLADPPDFNAWMTAWVAAREAECNADPVRLRIADRLREIAPIPEERRAWGTQSFDVVLVGGQFRMWHRRHGPQPLSPEQVADLEPLFREEKARRAHTVPERGAWFQGWVTVSSEGGASVSGRFMEEPNLNDKPIPIPPEDYRADLQSFPRSAFWTPAWLITRLGDAPDAAVS